MSLNAFGCVNQCNDGDVCSEGLFVGGAGLRCAPAVIAGRKVVQVLGDGDCQFSAIAQQTSAESPRALRDAVVAHLDANNFLWTVFAGCSVGPVHPKDGLQWGVG